MKNILVVCVMGIFSLMGRSVHSAEISCESIRLETVFQVSPNVYSVRIEAVSGINYIVDSSEDLMNWIGVSGLLNTSNLHETIEVEVTVPPATTQNRTRFFRVKGFLWNLEDSFAGSCYRDHPPAHEIPLSELTGSGTNITASGVEVIWPLDPEETALSLAEQGGTGGAAPKLAEIEGNLTQIAYPTATRTRMRFRFLNEAPPVYTSTKVETKVWEGFVIPPPGLSVFYFHSDDGVTVEINGRVVHNQFGVGQTWNKPNSFWRVSCTDGTGTRKIPVKVTYSNLEHGGADDIDGCTMYVYSIGQFAPLYGPSEIAFFNAGPGNERLYAIQLEVPSDRVTWSASANISIVETNDDLGYVMIRATGLSEVAGADWVQTTVSDPLCGLVQTNRHTITVVGPYSVQQIARTTIPAQTHRVGARIDYQVLNQFGKVYTLGGFISEHTFDKQTPTPFIGPNDSIDVELPDTGIFTDQVSGPRSSPPIIRGQVFFVSPRKGASGSGRPIGAFWHIFDPDMTIIPMQKP